ncbi:hypothetical protein SSABA_v1c03890 [Spiroplasma sabaudiense Ar-1343]|uniref:Lipoprotein n=1 Tax=Spiroplasma sabaudiense Ar-1343 TaxID=1276257 RepID=W6A9I7_9MOLU|nr:hypothetical protein [Spiroplasma sabaudiense]AHI53798.1 hypothetical protein SSABA_v1c03890 [Spiroplasma sabaudiense Ar-1343]
MKKLLTILATSSLAVSAPLSVVACNNNKKPDTTDEFDFEVAKRDALSLISTITSSYLNTNLSKYYFIDEEDEPNLGFEFLSFQNLDELIATNGGTGDVNISEGSEAYKGLSEDIQSIIEWNTISREVNTAISSDINLAGVLYEKQNPLQNFYDIRNAKLSLLDEGAIKLSYQISTPVTLRDQAFEKEITHIASNFEMNFIRIPDLATELSELSDKIQTELASSQFANKFEFISDSGDALKTAQFSQTNSNVGEVFNELLTNLPSIDNNLTTDVSQLTISSQYLANNVTDSTSGYIGTHEWSNDSDSRVTNIKDYFIRNKISSDELSKIIAANYSGYVKESQPKDFPNTGDTTSSIAMSVYRTLYSMSISARFKNMLAQTGSQFEIDANDNEEKRVVGVFGMKVNNLFVNYQNPNFPDKTISFALPENYVFSRQKTSFANTQDLFNDFIKVSLEFNKQLYNFEDDNEDYIFKLNLPPNLSLADLQFNKRYKNKDYFDELIYQEILKFKNKNPESKVEDYINGYTGFGTEFEVNEQGYIRFYHNNAMWEKANLAFLWINTSSNLPGGGDVFGAKAFFATVAFAETGPTKVQFILE